MVELKEYPNYFACEDGQIWDEKRKMFLHQCRRSKKAEYCCVTLKKDGIFKVCNVHRLIASAFIPNPYNLPEVNHKDENPRNNSVDNLEWCNRTYNNNYGTRNKRSGNSQLNRLDVSKPVVQKDKLGNIIETYPSAMEAYRQTNISRAAICRVCNKIPKYNTAGGYIWEWA